MLFLSKLEVYKEKLWSTAPIRSKASALSLRKVADRAIQIAMNKIPRLCGKPLSQVAGMRHPI